jgi:hypothetical protein
LYLSGNQLSGNIPSSLGNLVNLDFLYLSNNHLSGKIPSSLGNLRSLENLLLSDNQLSGTIPSSIGNLESLETLNLSTNQLSGSIPSALGKLPNLFNLYLQNNQLNGNIPSSLGNSFLFNLYLNNNQLSGGIPSSIGNLEFLETLDLSHNKLNGKIPLVLGNLQFLQVFNLSYNCFTFSGMEFIAKTFPFAIYSPQALIPVHQNGNELSVSAGGSLTNNTYKWCKVVNMGLMHIATIKGDSVFHPSENGIYEAKVTNSVATELTLKSEPIKFVASSQLVQSATSQNALQEYNKTNIFIVYPNPAKDIVHIQTNGKAILSLTDQSGKVLLTETIEGNGVMNVTSLSAGLYYLKES